MAEKATCHVTNSEAGRGAFAIRADNDEGVYVPQRIAEMLKLEEMDTIEAVMVRNQRETPPWMAVHVAILERAALTGINFGY